MIQLDQDLTHKIEQSESRLESLIKDLRMEMLKGFHAIQLEMQDLRMEIQDVRSEIKVLKGEIKLIRWMGAFTVAFVTVLATFPNAFDYLRHFHF